MDSKNENEMVIEALIYAQESKEHALKNARNAKTTSEEDHWWSVYDNHSEEFEGCRHYLLDDSIADVVIEIVQSSASYLPRKTLVELVLSRSQRKQ